MTWANLVGWHIGQDWYRDLNDNAILVGREKIRIEGEPITKGRYYIALKGDVEKQYMLNSSCRLSTIIHNINYHRSRTRFSHIWVYLPDLENFDGTARCIVSPTMPLGDPGYCEYSKIEEFGVF